MVSRQSIGIRGRGETPSQSPPITPQPNQSYLRLRQLSQLLIDPIADLLPNDSSQRVVFIPQEELFLVPFPALIDANGKFLIQSHTISTSPSIQVLSLAQQLQPKSHSPIAADPAQVLVVGNPTLPANLQLSPLPGAEQEARAIANQWHTQPLLGNAATEPAVVQRMATARLIHLATHGLLEYGDPKASGVRDMPGAIALAPAGEADGLLTSSEISSLKLQADLVVLSACDTGQGDITGDGVVGLSRSLISAGVPSVMVTLWKIPDESTAPLMSEFYRQLQQQPNKAQALRQAMLKTMQQHPDPIDWAAFTLIGEAN